MFVILNFCLTYEQLSTKASYFMLKTHPKQQTGHFAQKATCNKVDNEIHTSDQDCVRTCVGVWVLSWLWWLGQ